MPKRLLFAPAQIKQCYAFVFDCADDAAFVEAAVVTSPAKLILNLLQRESDGYGLIRRFWQEAAQRLGLGGLA